MESEYARDWDRETRRHFDEMHARGQYYGFLITTRGASSAVQEEVMGILNGDAQVYRDANKVFFAGPIGTRKLGKIIAYAEKSDQVISTKALRGPYEFFPVTPDHLLERLVEYSS
jgi:hypothetical protein